jgi:hypothetical protein
VNLPDSNLIPAPLWLITSLHILTLSLHLVAMNLVFGGIAVVLAGRFERRWEHPTVLRFIAILPSAMAAVVTLGVAPLLFLQLVYPGQVYSASIVSGWYWLLIIPAVILAYYLSYGASLSRKGQAAGKAGYLLPCLLALAYVSLVYSSVFSMAERPSLIKQLYASTQTGLRWNPELGDYLFRWLHMILGAVTVGGFFVGLLGKNDPAAFSCGKKFFTHGMSGAALAGVLYLVSLQDLLPAFMRSQAIWALTIAILLSVVSLHFFYKRLFAFSGAALFISLILMVIARHQVRLLKLQGQFDPGSWRIIPQWSPFTMFVVCFVVALGLIAYMLRMFFSSEA